MVVSYSYHAGPSARPRQTISVADVPYNSTAKFAGLRDIINQPTTAHGDAVQVIVLHAEW